MTVHIGTDHRGFKLKEWLREELATLGHEVIDHGATVFNPDDDYPDYTFPAAEAVASSEDPQTMGIVLCGSGVGASIAANKVDGIRCVLGFKPDQVSHARKSDNCNVLALAADYLRDEQALQMVTVFLDTHFFSEAEDVRRITKISKKEAPSEG